MSEEVHTSLNHEKSGLDTIKTNKEIRINVLNPDNSDPLRIGPRFTLSNSTLGRLEKLAKARFTLGQIVGYDLNDWFLSEELHLAVAQSINASSAIEGEGIHVDRLSLILNAVTNPDYGIRNTELTVREKTFGTIYQACFWALKKDWAKFLSYDFVLELHQRMFSTTNPEIAGKIKTKPVSIKGAGYNIQTLPPEKCELFLRKLCARVNDGLEDARDNSTASMFLIIAEFISDFLAIHPFSDGNGRTARLLSTYLLEKAGYGFAKFYPLDSIIFETREKYYYVLFHSQKNWYQSDEDLSLWIGYYTESIFNQFIRAYMRAQDEAVQKK